MGKARRAKLERGIDLVANLLDFTSVILLAPLRVVEAARRARRLRWAGSFGCGQMVEGMGVGMEKWVRSVILRGAGKRAGQGFVWRPVRG